MSSFRAGPLYQYGKMRLHAESPGLVRSGFGNQRRSAANRAERTWAFPTSVALRSLQRTLSSAQPHEHRSRYPECLSSQVRICVTPSTVATARWGIGLNVDLRYLEIDPTAKRLPTSQG
jgi:hypothetical protein